MKKIITIFFCYVTIVANAKIKKEPNFLMNEKKLIEKKNSNKKLKFQKPIHIPFTLKSNHIFIKVKINGQSNLLNFVFDTGATASVLDSTIAIKYNIKSLNTQTSIGATGNNVYHISSINKLQIGNLDLSKISCVLVNLKHLNGEEKIDGIIGYDILQNYVVKIDYDNSELVIYNTISECSQIYKNQLKFDFGNSGIPIPQITVAIQLKTGENFNGKVFMDSGANSNFILNTNITKDNDLLKKFNPKITSGVNSLTGKSKEYNSTIEKLWFNNQLFNDVPIDIPLSAAGVNAFPNLLGILGNGILKKQNWIFDYKNQIAFYETNKFAKKNFEYPCTHFSIQLKDDIMFFSDIQPNSKEFKEGIKNNMKIVSVNNYVANNYYDKIKKLLKTPNIELIIVYKPNTGQNKKIKVHTSRKI